MSRSLNLTAATLVTAVAAAVLSVLPMPAQAEPARAARPVVELPLVHVVGKRVAPAVERMVVELPRVEIVVNRSAASAARVADKSANGEKPRAPRG